LGIGPDEYNQPVETFSGGWKMRGKRILFIGFNAGSTVCCRSVPRVVDRLPEVLKRDAIPRAGGRRPGRPPRPKR
jgi:hypothetical protein